MNLTYKADLTDEEQAQHVTESTLDLPDPITTTTNTTGGTMNQDTAEHIDRLASALSVSVEQDADGVWSVTDVKTGSVRGKADNLAGVARILRDEINHTEAAIDSI